MYTVFDDAGIPVRRIGVITDITAEVQGQMRLQENLRQQREISSKKSTFVRTASHELRTPISSIYSGLELIELLSENVSDKTLSQKIGFFARQSCQQIKRLNTLISDISTLEKYNSGEIASHFSDFEVVRFCRNIINRIQSENVLNQQIQFTSAIHEQLVNLDSTLLDLCLTNLLGNALKYSTQTKMAVQVILSQTEDGIQLVVKDYGIGISAEELAKVGTYFFRASNSMGVTGSGLGLVFVRLAINLLGGSLEISSELTKGTACILKFPTRIYK
ncbi:sensor histidine kinase [Spirosoma linguale]